MFGSDIDVGAAVSDPDPDEVVFRQTRAVFSAVSASTFETCDMCSLPLFAETGVKSAFVWDYFEQRIDGHFVLWRVFGVSLT